MTQRLSFSDTSSDTMRPVMTREQMTRLTEQVLSMTSADTVMVNVRHTAQSIARFAHNQILLGEDGDQLELSLITQYGSRAQVEVKTNQLSDSTLRALVLRCEAIAREQIGSSETLLHQQQPQDTYVPVALWHDATVQAMTTTRRTVVPALIDTVTRRGFTAAGFVGLMARATGMLTKEGVTAFCDETDSEVTVTARANDGKSSGWAGQAARDWSVVNYGRVAEQAAEVARMSQGAQALEPGRRTAILTPAAVTQLFRHLVNEFSAFYTDEGHTAFSKAPRGNKLGQRVFDPRVTMSSDPADPEGGYRNFFSIACATPKMTWVNEGRLVNLAYDPAYAMERGKAYADVPSSLRMAGGPSSLEQMIAQCTEGIYVNRFSNVDLLDLKTGLMTGVTRDGCFLVKNGKIDRPVKNFRFLDSPFFFLNRLDALGSTARAPFGYTPPSPGEYQATWPRPPMIVPPIMVRDFNFNAMADAV